VEFPPFAVTYDYRCPFARNIHEHLVVAQLGGAGFNVTFMPFSLDQAHREDDEESVFENPSGARGIRPILASLVAMENYPDRFLTLHRALFSARHDQARDVEQPETLAQVLQESGLDPLAVEAEMDRDWPLAQFREAHTSAVEKYSVFGVPTFIVGEQAVFVRVMTRPTTDPRPSRDLIGQLLTMIEKQPEINEFKHTRLPS
jgi:protein-disulfide isomerase-like protein with CxxC motif